LLREHTRRISKRLKKQLTDPPGASWVRIGIELRAGKRKVVVQPCTGSFCRLVGT
jgi:hypothetical protein